MAYTTIDDPSAHIHVQTYSGSGSSGLSVTNDANAGDFKPDVLWVKRRDSADNLVALDSTRGNDRRLKTNSTDGEDTDGTALFTFETDGFDVDTTDGNFNASGGTYVAWQWKLNGGTTSSNSDGSITTTVQANTTAGASCLTYTSASGGRTIGHGLGVKPHMYIIKERSTNGDDWFVYHHVLGAGKKLRLSGGNASESDTNIWQNTEPTSTIAYLQNDGGGVNQNSGGNQNYVAWFYTSIKGYSKFGRYKGNGINDGPMIYTGFKPKVIWIKCAVGHNEAWHIWDNQRVTSGGNPNQAAIEINTNGSDKGDSTPYNVDFLSTGFKIREDHDLSNGDTDTYVYAAWAENPFVTSDSVPTTAQ